MNQDISVVNQVFNESQESQIIEEFTPFNSRVPNKENAAPAKPKVAKLSKAPITIKPSIEKEQIVFNVAKAPFGEQSVASHANVQRIVRATGGKEAYSNHTQVN